MELITLCFFPPISDFVFGGPSIHSVKGSPTGFPVAHPGNSVVPWHPGKIEFMRG